MQGKGQDADKEGKDERETALYTQKTDADSDVTTHAHYYTLYSL